tara:strand:- start:193 stop:693 length:501 start_codon:yes stop_codon:yes gene_type:complete
MNLDHHTVHISSDDLFKEFIFDTTTTTIDTSFVLTETLDEGKNYFLRIRGYNDAGFSGWSDTTQFSTILFTSNEQVSLPVEFNLFQNYPNPFNPSTTIKYGIPEASHVSILVYNMLGKKVATIVDERKSSGWYTVRFDASNLASGFYFYRIIAKDFIGIKKMMLIK